MLSFVKISTRFPKQGTVEIYPKFIIGSQAYEDLMIRGGGFYAVWCEDEGLWSTDEQDVISRVDQMLSDAVEEVKAQYPGHILRVAYMWDGDSGSIDRWHKYTDHQLKDHYTMLDESLIFANTKITKKDYASKKLSYPLTEGPCSAWDKLIGTLYSEEERHKIEWAIGSIVTGDSKRIQKFMVLYGAAGTGKSTILNVIQQLFEGYYCVFDAKALGSSSNSFALEPFNGNPLVAIQHDGDLSRIEDNTRLNSLVAHEMMTVNEKFKSTYATRFKAFLFMGTNKPVKITDAKSGLMRRLIDVSPSGNKLPLSEYKDIVKHVSFELGQIANHCKEVYLADPGAYDDYVPLGMMQASNDFYNYVISEFHNFKKEDGTTLQAAWEKYNKYCDAANVPYKMSRRQFGEELKNYFQEFYNRITSDDGTRVRSFYSGFKADKFDFDKKKKTVSMPKPKMDLPCTASILDDILADCPAQYAVSDDGGPFKPWAESKTKLKDIDTRRVHYVKPPKNMIVIDFDLKNSEGKKDFMLNAEAASSWPPTYAELSKGGQGLHLHYIYDGDVTKLSSIYSPNIEVKVFTKGSSLRRRLSKCNDLPVAHIDSGLPLKEESKKMLNKKAFEDEKALRTMIERIMRKEVPNVPGTKSGVDLINKILNETYESGLSYDISDMNQGLMEFALSSTNHPQQCLNIVANMKLRSEEPSEPDISGTGKPIAFFDVEVFPNLFLVCWKYAGKDQPVVRMFNPEPKDIEEMTEKLNLIGFNCRRYDNHMLYARMIGYSIEELYNLSQNIINVKKGSRGQMFGEAYNLSYTDIYDFASAGNKKSLKKFEIEIGINHKELGLPWDQSVPENQWTLVAEYCDNDVIATEAVFEYLKGDWIARQILAEWAGMTVNDTTNQLTTKIIFGDEKNPQGEFCYRDLSQPVKELDQEVASFLEEACPEMMSEPHGKAKSLLPYFPGYTYDAGKSVYKGIEVGEGGYVYAKHGISHYDALLDVASMHPHSAIAECLFGPKFTEIFRQIVEGRVSIKHQAWNALDDHLGGILRPFIARVEKGEFTSDDLANALKTAVNSVYGLTAASFDNAFRDKRNRDNIVAKRGALFMVDLKEAVYQRGYSVIHIKTDSIKIENADPDIIKFVMDFGRRYGYTFEHEATYERMCLVNDAVYVCRYASQEWCMEHYGYVPSKNKKHAGEWEATGKQFQVPYVFKTLFSHEPIKFEDMRETISVTTALYLGVGTEDNPDYKFVGKVGAFTPMKNGKGHDLLRQGTDKDGNPKYSFATGTKGYKWLESEMVRDMDMMDDIDLSYYNKQVDDAIASISEFGDVERFLNVDIVDDVEDYLAPWEAAEPPWDDEPTPFDVR